MKRKVKGIIFSTLVLFLSSCQARRGEGVETLQGTLLIFSILIIGMLFFFVREALAKKKRSKLTWGQVLYQKLRLPVLVVAIFTISIVAMNSFFEGKSLKQVINRLEKEEWEELKEGSFWKYEEEKLARNTVLGITKLYKSDSLNDLIFVKCVQWWKRYEENPFRGSSVKWESHFEYHKDPFRRGIISYYQNETMQALTWLNQAKQSRTGVNYYHGLNQLKQNDFLKAESYFLKEISHNGWVEKSLNQLKYIYQHRIFLAQNQKNDPNLIRGKLIRLRLLSLYEYPNLHKHLPFGKITQLRASLFNRNAEMYAGTFLAILFVDGTNLSVFIGAWIIFIVWMYFLWQQNPFSQLDYQKAIITGLNAFLVFVLVLPLYLYVAEFLSIEYGHKSMMYFVFGVGLFEEIIKFLPVLIFALIYKKEEEPYHYMIIAALSALVFATLENKIYFERYSIEIMNTRGLFTVILHIFDTTLITYFLVWRLFRKEGKFVALWTLLGFVITVFSHAIYDWFIVNDLHLYSMLMFPISIHILAGMYNNTLNVSGKFNYEKMDGYQQNIVIITLSLVLIIISRYVFVAIDYDSVAFANDALAGSAFSSLYLLVFLSISLGKLDIFHGYWKKISVPTTLGDLLFPRIVNSGEYLDRYVWFSLNKKVKVSGVIIDRALVHKKDDWYIIQLDEPMLISKVHTNYVFVNFDDYNASIDEDYYCNVTIGIPYRNLEKFDGTRYHGKMKYLGTRRLKVVE